MKAERVARLISWIGHPLVLVTIAVAVVVFTQLPAQAGLTILGILILSTVAPLALLLVLGLRSGRWRDADVSQHEERKRFYPMAIPLSAGGTLIAWLTGAPHYILRGAVVTLLALCLAALINFWFKISLHALFAVYCATVMIRINFGVGALFFAVALAVCWSRLVLRRHDARETATGAALGLVAGAIAGWTSL